MAAWPQMQPECFAGNTGYTAKRVIYDTNTGEILRQSLARTSCVLSTRGSVIGDGSVVSWGRWNPKISAWFDKPPNFWNPIWPSVTTWSQITARHLLLIVIYAYYMVSCFSSFLRRLYRGKENLAVTKLLLTILEVGVPKLWPTILEPQIFNLFSVDFTLILTSQVNCDANRVFLFVEFPESADQHDCCAKGRFT